MNSFVGRFFYCLLFLAVIKGKRLGLKCEALSQKRIGFEKQCYLLQP